MSTELNNLESRVRALRRSLAEFSKREQVSIIEMISLLGAMVLDLGIRLERTAGIEDRIKTYDVPLAGELLEVVAAFGKRHHINPVEMLAVLGGTIVELGADMESAVISGNKVN